MSTITDANGNYEFQLENGLYNLPQPFQIQVELPSGDYGTIEGTRSNINTSGYSDVFELNPNTGVQINAGLRSMVVTTTQDDPNVAIPKLITLRDAIETGNNGPPTSAVTFAQGVTGTIALQKALDPIKKTYSINGLGSNISVFGTTNANNLYVIFSINQGVTSTISGLTIKGGYSVNCGGVDNNGNLTLENDVIADNQAIGWGGGIDNQGDLNLIDCQVNNNQASTWGGGIYNIGTLHVWSGSSIMSNQAADEGGGLYNAPSALTQIYEDSTISLNESQNLGGGIYNDNGGTVTMSLGAINENTATNFGGGIYNNQGSLTLRPNTTIKNNSTTWEGGGLYTAGGNVKMTGAVVTSNTVAKTKAHTGYGGGIYVYKSTLTITDGSKIVNNKANNSGNGGGIYISTGQVTFTGGTISGNTANNNGGGIYNLGGVLTLGSAQHPLTVGPDNNAFLEGGGMYLHAGSNTTFNGCTVNGNTVGGLGQGPGVYWQNGGIVLPNPLTATDLTDNDDQGGKPFQGS